MDPLSITASAVTFIGACRRLALGFDLLKDLSHATHDVRSLVEELAALQSVLTAINLVALKRQGPVSGLDLSHTFRKVDNILTELCKISGVPFECLKDGNEPEIERLRLQLRDRVRWACEKKRVALLCGKLKTVRMALANKLAGLTL